MKIRVGNRPNSTALRASGLDESGNPIRDPIVREAYVRFQRCQDWEESARQRMMSDYKFAHADADNGYQWPNDIRQNRQLDQRPCLTMNIVQVHNRQIINDAKQNKSGIAVRPAGGGASYRSAMAMAGLVRHIEYQSNAQEAYSTGVEFQVDMGIGYWRVATDYAHDDTFEQEIYIRRIPNPMNVYLDPDIKEKDGSDAKFGFIFDDMLKDEFVELHPDLAEFASQGALGDQEGWMDDEYVRVAEYFRVVQTKDRLIQTKIKGVDYKFRESAIGEKLASRYIDDPSTRIREIPGTKVEWYLIVGEQIAETRTWLGRYVPIIRCIGTETVIEGELDRMGHTRAMKDAQRMYNYWASSAVEHVALQGKTPWIGAVEAFEGFENYWKTANIVNHSFLPYNGFLDDGITKIEAPARAQPPQMAPAYIQGMGLAQQDIMLVSGQFQAQMGQPGNERSGKAINERQRQGDNATYHFIDNAGTAIRFTGKIVLDLIPKIYDSRRIQQVLAEDGSDQDVEIDPTALAAYAEQTAQDGKTIKRILNPTIGYYDVQADVGPAFATRRQETFNALVQIITQAPQLIPIIGDILLDVADFPKADEAARRLKNMVPPAALGKGPSPQEQSMMTMLQNATAVIKELQQQNALKEIQLKGRAELRDIDVYKAETDRVSALSKLFPEADPQGLLAILQDLVGDVMRTDLGPVLEANKDDLAAAAHDRGGAYAQGPEQGHPSVMGAKRAPDGNWYVPDPNRQGGWAMLTGGANNG